jgi:glyoxylase-like metal-dependent hydrolase (beta-lactamase superfamily II)
VRVDRELDDGEILDIGAGARVVAAPGHTDGMIVLHLPAERILFSGDAIERTPDGQTIAPVF